MGDGAIPFVDAHFHLWDLARLSYAWLSPPFGSGGPNGDVSGIARTYLPSDYRADLARWNLLGAVHVDAGAASHQAVAESGWVQDLGDAGGVPTGFVAFADLTDPAVDAVLAAHARHARARGIRQIVNWHADPERTYGPIDVTRDIAWERGYARLVAHGLSFDLQCYPGQVPHIAAILARHPETPVMLNHLGMPVLSDADGLVAWRSAIRTLAALTQVSVKISGLGFIRHDWTIATVGDLIREVIDTFGTDRAMFASDVPTDKLFGSVDRHMETYATIAGDCSDAERRAMFGGNTDRLYQLNLGIQP